MFQSAGQYKEDFGRLLAWFELERRDFPWRVTRSPYHVWLSEIMLQQTQARTVVPYFERFLARFPKIADLAASDEQEVLKYWEGLGYYSRARNLHKTAQIVSEKWQGKFPYDFFEILALPGIGRYTAGAIAALAFEQAYPAVDGNVLRVLARFLDEAWQNGSSGHMRSVENFLLAYFQSTEFLKSGQKPSQINEALIELGATVCTPRQARCTSCPWSEHCLAFQAGTVAERPLPKKKNISSLSEYTVIVCQEDNNGRILVEKRPPTGLLASLWQFPMLDGSRSADEIERYLEDCGLVCRSIMKLPSRLHVFSHLRWKMMAYKVQCALPENAAGSNLYISEDTESLAESPARALWLNPEELFDLPFSAALFEYRQLSQHSI